MTVLDVLSARRYGRPAAPVEWRLRTLLGRITREPMVHFLLIGAVIFILGEHMPSDSGRYRIVVDAQHVSRLAENYERQFGQPPSRPILDTLIARYVDDEILYREGLATKIDAGDEVVRRRIIQKMQFLVQDLHAAAPPSESRLLSYYYAHASRYIEPERIAFTHIYFSPDKDGDEGAKQRALKVLASLGPNVTRAPERGDAYPDAYDFASIGPEEADRLFGETPISKDIFGAPRGHWSGPFRSGYGWHLVYVNAVVPRHLAPFARVQDRVRADWVDDEQAAANLRAFETLKHRYTIVVDSGNTAP
jgi:peptidyl-prolyl cis-trans isomerase C